MMNRCVLVGRLTKDPDLKYTANGVGVVNFTLAINRPFTNQQGEREADFINCTAWRKQAENVAQYLSKGSLAGVDGRMQSRTYDKDDGTRVFVVEHQSESVQFLDTKGSNNSSGGGNTTSSNGEYNGTGNYSGGGSENDSLDISDDDLPF